MEINLKRRKKCFCTLLKRLLGASRKKSCRAQEGRWSRNLKTDKVLCTTSKFSNKPVKVDDKILIQYVLFSYRKCSFFKVKHLSSRLDHDTLRFMVMENQAQLCKFSNIYHITTHNFLKSWTECMDGTNRCSPRVASRGQSFSVCDLRAAKQSLKQLDGRAGITLFTLCFNSFKKRENNEILCLNPWNTYINPFIYIY